MTLKKGNRKKGELTLITTPYPTFLDKIKPRDNFLFKLNNVKGICTDSNEAISCFTEKDLDPILIPFKDLTSRSICVGGRLSGKTTAMNMLKKFCKENNVEFPPKEGISYELVMAIAEYGYQNFLEALFKESGG